MKITDLQTYLVDTKAFIKWVFVKLTTDEGIVGYGEAGSAFRERAQAAAIQELKPLVVGRNPFEIRAFWSHAYKSHLDVRGPSSLHVSALGAIEFAMWDIVGKALGTPVYNLLGGKCRDTVRAYLHAQVWGGEVEPGPEVYVQLARERVAEGFSTIKFDPFWFAVPSDANIGRDELRRVVKIVSAVRKAVGDDVDVGIEFHAKFNTPAAIRIGLAFEEFDPFFIEEPTGSEDLDALRMVTDSLKAPVASGERLASRYAFKPMIDRHAVDILQVDPGRAGGLLGEPDRGRHGGGGLHARAGASALRPGVRRHGGAARGDDPQPPGGGVAQVLLPGGAARSALPARQGAAGGGAWPRARAHGAGPGCRAGRGGGGKVPDRALTAAPRTSIAAPV